MLARIEPIVKRLPAAARAKLARLDAQWDELVAVLRLRSERVREASERVADAEARLRDLQAMVPRPLAQIEEQETRVREAEERRSEAQRLHEAAAAVEGGPLGAIETWLDTLPVDTSFAPHAPSKPKMGAAGPEAALVRARERVAELRRELDALRSAPLTVADAKAAARREVEQLAAAGTPDVRGLFTGGEISWPGIWSRETGELADGRGVLIWLFREQLLAALDREIEAAPQAGASPLAEADRPAALAAAAAALLAAEREEEAVIEELESRGATVIRRADASPLAVLGLAETGA